MHDLVDDGVLLVRVRVRVGHGVVQDLLEHLLDLFDLLFVIGKVFEEMADVPGVVRLLPNVLRELVHSHDLADVGPRDLISSILDLSVLLLRVDLLTLSLVAVVGLTARLIGLWIHKDLIFLILGLGDVLIHFEMDRGAHGGSRRPSDELLR